MTSVKCGVSTPADGAARDLCVYVDEDERTVCGVTSSTTCQEVIYALAHATARTERSLAPTDCPLQLLDNWNEHATSVRFILKHLDALPPPPPPTASHGSSINHSYASLPRQKYTQLQQRSNSVMAQPLNGPIGASSTSNVRPAPPSYEEALVRRQMMIRQQQPRPPPPTVAAATRTSFERDALMRTINEQRHKLQEQDAHMNRLQKEEADLADSTRRTDASLHELHTQIAHYESQKARLRALIDAAGENDHIPNEQQYQQHLLNASAEAGELRAKIYDIDRKLALKSDEIEKLQAEVARMDEERPSDVVEVDDEMSELDDRISDRQTVLKQLLDDAQRLGIKLKPGVWV